jgi:DENN (AEX-3) domain
MQEYLDAPVPFIIGVPRKVWESMGYKSYESDLIIYDLDNKYFIKSLSLPILPSGGEKNITESLNLCTKQIIKITSSRYEHTKKLENGLNAIQQIRNIIVAILCNVKNFISSHKKSKYFTR